LFMICNVAVIFYKTKIIQFLVLKEALFFQ